ncbi:MAG: TiaS agmantine-binding domain-containing protein [Candidatus Methanofastidiosia archaeon]
MFIGIDDTDSRSGMCTTFVCKTIMDYISQEAHIVGFPRLIRLNPNIPYKTRGNGALSFKVDGDPAFVWKTVKKGIREFLIDDPSTNPGAVLFEGEIPKILTDFYHRALHEILTIEEAHSLAKEIDAKTMFYGNGRGIIGALASIGADLPDYTFELIAYRESENIGTPRHVDVDSVKRIDRLYNPTIFDTYDWHNNYIAIAPNAPCPVLYGLRGEDYKVIQKAANELLTEQVFKQQVFITNQATDAHIEAKTICNIKEYNSVHIKCKVTEAPHFEHKGHLFFSVEDGAKSILCAAYEPTKEFRKIVAQLLPGDEIEVWGGVKHTAYGMTLNLEKINVLSLVQKTRYKIPLCCGKRMRSIGKMKGYRCKKCSKKISESALETIHIKRDLKKGFYEVPIIARRHLAKPLSRMKL